jgi:hypothetical protein
MGLFYCCCCCRLFVVGIWSCDLGCDGVIIFSAWYKQQEEDRDMGRLMALSLLPTTTAGSLFEDDVSSFKVFLLVCSIVIVVVVDNDGGSSPWWVVVLSLFVFQ